MKSIPEIPVVMGVYNGEKELAEAFESILNQRDANFEFIIVNDGSTDRSAEMLDAFAARDNRVRVIHQKNSGLTRALVRGCNEACGEFIARQDADDVSLPDRLSLQASLLRDNADLALVSSWADWIGPEGELLFVQKVEDDVETSTQKLLSDKQGPAAHGSVMFRKKSYEACGGYRPAFYFAQDVDLWLRLGYMGQMAYVQQSLYQYRVSFSSISGTRGGLQAEYDRLAHACHQARLAGDDEAELLAEALRLRSVKRSISTHRETGNPAYFIGRCLLARGDKRARGYLWKAIRKSPWHGRAWVSLLNTISLPVGMDKK